MLRHRRGQAFVELALILPVMLIMLAGMVEVVFAFNDYLQMLDGARGGARDSADLNPYPKAASAYDSIKYCTDPDGPGPLTATNNFFRRTACSTARFLAPVNIDPNASPYNGNPCIDGATEPDKFVDDIVISIFTTAVTDDDGAGGDDPVLDVKRFNSAVYDPDTPYLAEDTSEIGWSYVIDQATSPQKRGMCSQMKLADLEPLLLGTSDTTNAAPNIAYLLVEVFYRHYQLFDLPAFGDVIANPIRLHAYAIFPLPAAEPTPTPDS